MGCQNGKASRPWNQREAFEILETLSKILRLFSALFNVEQFALNHHEQVVSVFRSETIHRREKICQGPDGGLTKKSSGL
jgi:hypothetical protein